MNSQPPLPTPLKKKKKIKNDAIDLYTDILDGHRQFMKIIKDGF